MEMDSDVEMEDLPEPEEDNDNDNDNDNEDPELEEEDGRNADIDVEAVVDDDNDGDDDVDEEVDEEDEDDQEDEIQSDNDGEDAQPVAPLQLRIRLKIPAPASRSAGTETPGVESEDSMDSHPSTSTAAKPMTTRQAVLASMVGSSHVSLGGSRQSKKKVLNESELALRREETARKRKNMTEKKLEDEKVSNFFFLIYFMTVTHDFYCNTSWRLLTACLRNSHGHGISAAGYRRTKKLWMTWCRHLHPSPARAPTPISTAPASEDLGK